MPTHGLDPLIVLALLLPVTHVSVFVHELGSAVMGRAAGLVVKSSGIGTGRPFLVMTVGGTRVFRCRSRPLQGLTFCYFSSFSPDRRRMVPFLAGGIVAASGSDCGPWPSTRPALIMQPFVPFFDRRF